MHQGIAFVSGGNVSKKKTGAACAGRLQQLTYCRFTLEFDFQCKHIYSACMDVTRGDLCDVKFVRVFTSPPFFVRCVPVMWSHSVLSFKFGSAHRVF